MKSWHSNQRQPRQRTLPYYQYNMIVFKPSELNGCNVHGVENRMPLDTRNIDMIKEVVYQYFLTPPPSEHELLPHDWQKAIDTYLQSHKLDRPNV